MSYPPLTTEDSLKQIAQQILTYVLFCVSAVSIGVVIFHEHYGLNLLVMGGAIIVSLITDIWVTNMIVNIIPDVLIIAISHQTNIRDGRPIPWRNCMGMHLMALGTSKCFGYAIVKMRIYTFYAIIPSTFDIVCYFVLTMFFALTAAVLILLWSDHCIEDAVCWRFTSRKEKKKKGLYHTDAYLHDKSHK